MTAIAPLVRSCSRPLAPKGPSTHATTPPQEETSICCFGLAAAFANGVGQVDLRREAVAFKLHPLAQISGSPVSVPVLVKGPCRAIQGRLDATGLDKLGC